MRALRPRYDDRDAWVQRIDELQRPDGYRLVAAFDEGDEAVAVAGFREGHNLPWGHFLYVDDLSTLPEARGHGYGAALMQWLIERAREEGCAELHLDSGVGPERESAHRLYFGSHLRIASYHFTRVL